MCQQGNEGAMDEGGASESEDRQVLKNYYLLERSQAVHGRNRGA